MSLYTIALFVHMIGLIALFGGLVILQQGGARLRTATAWQEARTWLQLLRTVPGMFIGGSVFLLASGLYMTTARWTPRTPWVVVPMVIVVFVIVEAVVVGRSLARIGRASSEREGTISEKARMLLWAPALWSSAFAMNGATLGALWLMTTKPGWAVSIGVPLVLAALGSLIGWAMTRSRTVDRTRPIAARPLAHGER